MSFYFVIYKGKTGGSMFPKFKLLSLFHPSRNMLVMASNRHQFVAAKLLTTLN